MNVPAPMKKKGAVVPVDVPSMPELPVSARLALAELYLRSQDFEELLDLHELLTGYVDDFVAMIAKLDTAIRKNTVTRHLLIEAQVLLEWEPHTDDLADYNRLWAKLNHRGLYDIRNRHGREDAKIKNDVVTAHIVRLLSADPNPKVEEPALYLLNLVEEIVAVRPSVVAVESAFRELRRSPRFVKMFPKVQEVLATITQQEQLWHREIDWQSWKPDLAEAIERANDHLAAAATSMTDADRRITDCDHPISVSSHDSITRGNT